MGQDLTILNNSQSFIYKKSNIVPNYLSSSGCSSSLLVDYSGTGSTTYPTQSTSPVDVGTYSAFIYFLNGSINTSTGLPCSGSGTISFSITPKNLSIIGIIANNKEYDGNNIVPLSGSSSLLTAQNAGSGTVIDGKPYVGDNVILNGSAYGLFPNSLVENSKIVTISSLTISGTSSFNYNLVFPTGLTANIIPKDITGSFVVNNKQYDGNNTATVTSTSPGAIVGSEVVTLNGGTATFNNASVANGKTVTLSGATLGGANASNYNLVSVNTTTANITPKDITGSFVVSNKQYDGNNAATVTSTSPGAIVGSEVVTLNGGTATFNNASVANGKTVTLSGATLGGANASNYNLVSVNTTTANITPAPLTIAGISGANKVYDRNTKATVIGTPHYIGLVSGENFNVVGTPTYSFANKNAGTAKPITVLGFTTPNGNYTLSAQPTGIIADITPKLLTVTGMVPVRIYDATTNTPGIVLDNDRITGDIVNVSITSAAFENPNAGVNKNIVLSGLSILPADDGGNYFLANSNSTIQGTILPLPINIIAIDTIKTELDPDPPFTYQPVSLLGTDVFTGSLSRFPGESAGDYPMTIGSLSAGINYTLNFTTANFKIKPLVTNFIFEIPNAFTPNRDGYNDQLKFIKNYRVTGLNYFRIYNRSGQLVFESRNFADEWNGRRMNDGSSNILESDLYIWVAEFTTLNDPEPVKRTGSVLLLK